MSKWQALDTENGVHVLPLNDLILHTHSTQCTCCPTVTLSGHTCCGKLHARKIYTHHAMDGRE